MSYVDYLAEGFHVVTPNKKGEYRLLGILPSNYVQQRKKPIVVSLYETTVGAGLPVIDTLQSLLKAGDELQRFEGILSGSLSYMFGKLEEGMTLSQATSYCKRKWFYRT